MSEATKKKLHYAWYILAVCVLINMIIHVSVMTIGNLYIVPIYNDLQIPRTLVSLQSIAMTIMAVVSAPFWGKIYKTKSIRHILPIAIGGTALCTILRSFMPNIWLMIALAFVKGFFFTGSTLLPISILLTIWFKKDRGLAVSIATIGTSIGGVFLSPLVESWISNYGWRVSDRIVGSIMFIVCVPLVALIVRSRPKDLQLLPYGMTLADVKVTVAGSATKNPSEETGMSFKEARKTPMFYLLLISVFCMTIAFGAALQIPAYLTDIGYGSAVAAKAVSTYSAVAIFGKLIIGRVTDKKSVLTGTIYTCVISILAFIFFILAKNPVALVGMIICYGLSNGITAVMPTLLTSRIFGKKDYGPIYGMVVSVNRFGGGVGTILVSILFDITGNYSIIWPVCTLAMVFCLVALVSSIKMSDKIIAKPAM